MTSKTITLGREEYDRFAAAMNELRAENERLRADFDRLNRYSTDELARLRAENEELRGQVLNLTQARTEGNIDASVRARL